MRQIKKDNNARYTQDSEEINTLKQLFRIMRTIGITGPAGFIGRHITRKFLETGNKIKASVTNISTSEKYEHLFEQNGDNLLL